MSIAIRVEAISKTYRSGPPALQNLSFNVRHGTITALLGGNGAGKTTTLSILLGVLLPDAGTVTVLGHNMAHAREQALKRMNFSSPYIELPNRLTIEQNLRVFGMYYNVNNLADRITELAQQLDFAHLLKRPYGQLSAGQKTRVTIAKSLLNKPELLLLDEPTASLDPDTADWVRSFLMDYQKQHKATILLASHNMPEVERMCDDVLMLRTGVLVDQGTPHELINRYGRQTMEEVFLA
ncbi:MAG: ABC transporter ATP-binding protein, partial [Alphaproteobacteria bacterium]|nr:ABC transporter ATP-binding protein [Alphaproteobacteria bacterium]